MTQLDFPSDYEAICDASRRKVWWESEFRNDPVVDVWCADKIAI